MAERVGFEPTLEFPLNTLSKRAPSATRPSLRRRLGLESLYRADGEDGCREEFRVCRMQVQSTVATNFGNENEINQKTGHEFRAHSRPIEIKKTAFPAVCIPNKFKFASRATDLMSGKGYALTIALAACRHTAAKNALKAIFVNHSSYRILAFFVE
jgi:hypothetical protein